MEKQFLDLKDVLPLGKSIIKVKPLPEFKKDDNGKFHPVEGSQQVGEIKNGANKGSKFYKYDSDVHYFDSVAQKDRNCQVVAWSLKEKSILDTGEAEVNILEKPILLDGEPTFTKNGTEAVKRVMYINPVPKIGLESGDQNQAENRLIEDIPVIEDDHPYEKDEPTKNEDGYDDFCKTVF